MRRVVGCEEAEETKACAVKVAAADQAVATICLRRVRSSSLKRIINSLMTGADGRQE